MAEHKNRVIKTRKKRDDWIEEHNSGESAEPEGIWDGSAPWSAKPLHFGDSRFEVLQDLLPTLRGRQRQVIELLMTTTTNQCEIARRLHITNQQVATHLRRVAKKISARCGV